MESNISPGDLLDFLTFSINEIKALSEPIKTQHLQQSNDKDAGFRSQHKQVENDVEDMVVQTDAYSPSMDKNISTNTVGRSESVFISPKLQSLKSRCMKCKISIKRIDANNIRTKPCMVVLKRLHISNVLKVHKLELSSVNWPKTSTLSKGKDNTSSSMSDGCYIQ